MIFKEIKIGDIANMKYGKIPPKEIVTEEGFPIFSGYRVTGYAKEFLYEKPQVVVVARGVGGTGDVKISPEKSWITNLSIVIELDEKLVNKQFLFYKLNLEPLKDKLNTGAAQAQITIDSLKSYIITLPDINVQEKIVNILKTYDDLIENNHRRIQLLEQFARLLYKEWFVYFRFPGHEHVKVVDGVPEGWNECRLVEIANIIMGQSPDSKHYNSNGIGLPFHQGVRSFGERFVNHEVYCKVNFRIAEPGDILCSVRAPVGRLNITLDKIVIGRGLSSIRSKNNYQSFLFYQLKNYFFKEDMIGSGAIFASVTKKDLENQILLCPPSYLINEFERISKPIDEQIKNLYTQNKRLQEARDLLLPRLMNGEIAV